MEQLTNKARNKHTEGVYIPFNGNLLTLKEAKKKIDKEIAKEIEYVVLITEAVSIKILKNNLPCGDVNFKTAQKEAEAYGEGWRCPNKYECVDILDWKYRGLEEALELIGGSWFTLLWSCCRLNAHYAWYADGTYGFFSSNYFYVSLGARPVSLFTES